MLNPSSRASGLSRVVSWLGNGVATVVLVVAAGCGQTANDPAKNANPPAAGTASSTVAIVKPVPKAIHLSVRQPGSLQAFEQTPIFAKIAGYVRKWNVDIGDHVKQDDVLAELYVPELVEELKQKEEIVKQSREAFEVATAR